MSDASTRAMAARIQATVRRCVVAGVDDDKSCQALQIELLADETLDEVEHFQPYGFTARPFAGAEAVALGVGGLRSHTIVLGVGDRRYRLTSLQEGEVAMHDDQGQVVHLTRDGIRISSSKGITIETEGDMSLSADGDLSLSADGNLSIDCADFTVSASGAAELGSDDVKIGNGATLDAARRTDAINDADDKISGGSSKVKIA
jgi:phage baseplate assembly protein V